MQDQTPTLTRRNLLQSTALAAGGAAVTGAETAALTPADPSSDGFSLPVDTETADLQFNPRNSENREPAVEAFLYEPLAEYNARENTFVPVLAADWSVSSDRLSITLSSNYYWHEVATNSGESRGGQPVTASDVVRQFRMDQAFGAEYWDVLSGVTVSREPKEDGGGTVRVNLKGDVNKEILLHDLLGQHLSHSPEYFEQAEKSAIESLTLNPEHAGPPIGTGPFKYASQDASRVSLKTAGSHPSADNINWQDYTFESKTSEHTVLDGLNNGSFAGTREAHYPEQFQEESGQMVGDSYTQVTNESTGGWGILLNHEHPHLQKRQFRKAIAHIFSSADAVESMTASVIETVALQTGLSPNQTREYLDGELGKFEVYGDEKRAGELLGDLGFYRTWEIWNDSRGGPLTLGFVGAPDPTQDTSAAISASEPAWYYGTQEFQRQLNEFFRDHDPDIVQGWFDGTHLNAPVGAVEQFTDVGVHDDIFAFLPARQWGHMNQTHPYHTFRSDMLMREASDLGFGPVVEVPTYGNPGGPEETIDIRGKLAALRRTTTESEERRLVRELAWIINESVPYLQGYYRPSISYLNTEGWEFPNTEELNVEYPSTHLPRVGNIQATE